MLFLKPLLKSFFTAQLLRTCLVQTLHNFDITACVKIHPIPHDIFQTKNQFLFKVWIALQYHERYIFCTSLAKTLYDIDRRSLSKSKLSDFRLLSWKVTKFLMSFFKSPVRFSLNIASTFRVMTPSSSCHFWKRESTLLQILHHSSKLWHITPLYFFWFKHDILLTAVAHNSTNFQTCHCSH